MRFWRCLAAFVVVTAALGLPAGAFEGTGGTFDTTSPAPPPAAKVYVFRAMGGSIATPEMDNLALRIRAKGVEAQVFSYVNWIRPANEAIARYKNERVKSPIILVGHSAGGDSTIRFARWLNNAGVPVDLIITLDPTRIAGRVPANVERFINVYSSSHGLGGGDPVPAKDFRGHFASIDLKDYSNIWHVYLPKMAGLQDKVVAKIVEVAGKPTASLQPAVPIEYPMQRGQPLELFDSGVVVSVKPGDTPTSVAARYGVPAWAIAAVNKIDPSRPISGPQVIVPRHLDGVPPTN